MRMLPAAVLLFSSLFFGFPARAQSTGPWKAYRIQPSHTYSLHSKKLIQSKKKGIEYNLADFYLYRNGKLVRPPKNKGYDCFPAACLCFKYDDTLLLNSGLGLAMGVGVGIKIYQGRFTSSLHANTDNKQIYKRFREDTAYTKNIFAEPETQSLKLYQTPRFMTNEVVIGEYRATYKKFYQKNAQSKDQLCRYTVRIVFKCRVNGGIDSMKSLTDRSDR